MFDTIQLDLYDNSTFLIDKHIGRAEIRLKNLEGMPEIFTSYYEVLEKKLSLGATSQVSRKALMTSGVGAIQAEIAYHYISTPMSKLPLGEDQRSMSSDFSAMDWLVDQQKNALLSNSIDNIDITHNRKQSDRELIEEFNRHLKTQRKTDNIQFKKFEHGRNQDGDDADDDDDDDYGDITQVDYPDDSSTDGDQQDHDGKKLGLTSENADVTKRVPLTYSVSRANNIINSESIASNENKKRGILETVSSFFGYSSSEDSNNLSSTKSRQHVNTANEFENLQKSQLLSNADDDTLKSFPILDTIGSWTMAKETNQVFRAIGKLLVAFVSISPSLI